MTKIQKYFMDPLYGKCTIDDIIYNFLFTMELQRLRDIRLSNINSIFLGSSNASRFEHSLGVAHLANILSDNLNFNSTDKYHLIIASLLHDAASPPFGHSIENLFKQYDPDYSHEKNICIILTGEESVLDDIYGFHTQKWGKEFSAQQKIRSLNIKGEKLDPYIVKDIITGKHPLGQFLNKDIDLDNIDNVYRLLKGMGYSIDTEKMIIKLIKSFSLIDNEREIIEDSLFLIKEWLKKRNILYNELMNNHHDFSSKTMIFKATDLALNNNKIISRSDWLLTDSEFIHELSKFPETENIIHRLRTGNLYCIEDKFWITDITDRKKIDMICNPEKRRELDDTLSKKLKRKIFIYYISDFNRSSREVEIKCGTSFISGSKYRKVGMSISRMLIGIFSERPFKKSFEDQNKIRNNFIKITGFNIN